MKCLLAGITVVCLVIYSGCAGAGPDKGQEHLLQAVSWYQHSAEMKALYYQCFNQAAMILKKGYGLPEEKQQAVVLDIDETVLDNSPQSAQQLIDDVAFNDKMWDEWCKLSSADALPGAVEFTKLADQLGVEVFYISNRSIHLLDATLTNLQKCGFPNADSAHVLLKTNSSSKDGRRESVEASHEIVMLIGDNLGDFDGMFDERQGGSANQIVDENRILFGTRFILLPNPIYGSWENPFRGKSDGITLHNKREALNSFRERKRDSPN